MINNCQILIIFKSILGSKKDKPNRWVKLTYKVDPTTG